MVDYLRRVSNDLVTRKTKISVKLMVTLQSTCSIHNLWVRFLPHSYIFLHVTPFLHSYINSFGVYQDLYVRVYLSDYSPSTIGWVLSPPHGTYG